MTKEEILNKLTSLGTTKEEIAKEPEIVTKTLNILKVIG